MRKKTLGELRATRTGLQLEIRTGYFPQVKPSNEALSINNVVNATVAKLSRFMSDAANSIELKTFGAIDTFTGGNQKDQRMIRIIKEKLESVNYMDVYDQRFEVIPGLDVTWLEYLAVLGENVGLCATLYEDFMTPFKTFISMGINDPESLSSAANGKKVVSFDFDSRNKELGKCLKGNQRIPTRRWGKLVKRNSDYLEVIDKTNLMVDSVKINNPELIRNEMEKIKELLETLSKQIVDPNLAYRLSKQNMIAISEATYNLAQGIEFYGVTYTNLLQHSKTIKEANDRIIKIY